MTVPRYASTIGPQVVDLAAMAGLYLDPWQQLVIEHMFGRRENGTLSSSEVAVIVARQNGKGAIIEAAQLAWLFLTDEPLSVYTAHEVKTANEAFLRIKECIDKTPKLSRRCLTPRNSNGQQAIRTRAGQRLNFLARSSGSGRGFTAPRLMLDEAMFLDERHTSALGPTLFAMADPQVCYFSSAPRGEDLVLNALCDRGEAGSSPRLSYFEWSARPGRAWDDREGWAEALRRSATG
jgi:phage terminase large subunit-like protein